MNTQEDSMNQPQPQLSLDVEEAEEVAPVQTKARRKAAVQAAEAPDTYRRALAVAEPQPTGLALVIERVLRNDDIPFEKLEKMLEMQERIDAMQARKAFDQAISAAKGEIPEITKNRHVGFEAKNGGAKTDYRHEDFAQIARAVDPILARHGLSYRYRTQQAEARVTVTCILAHRDGHSEETTLTSNVDASGNKNPIQAVGSAITYLQRYTLKAALGLAVSNDDDGATSGNAAGADTITEEQFHTLKELMEQAGAGGQFLNLYGIDHIGELPAKMFGPAQYALNQKIAARKAKGGADA
jgi:hypothetical protein